MITKSQVNNILNDPLEYHPNISWTLQGFGMLRCYLDDSKITRLHVWSQDHVIPQINESYSAVHTHPWNFVSQVFYGQLVNVRYNWLEDDYGPIKRQLMLPGADTEMLAKPEPGYLMETAWNLINTGETYHQHFYEIHRVLPFTGTVTVIDRDRGDRPDEAYTYFNHLGWISAAPRPATDDEVLTIIRSVGDTTR